MTVTTDFGLSDSYVAVMKAALLRHCPIVRMIDVTHDVPPQDVLCGSITLERAIDAFPEGTVHLAVVDPDVGTDRRILVVEINGQTVICPDNGLITWSWRLHPGGCAYELTWRPLAATSKTFHGRDIFAPAAGMIAGGETIKRLARPVKNPHLLEIAPAPLDARHGSVIQIDHFGNATTNIGYGLLRANQPRSIRIKGRNLGTLRQTYTDVAPGKPLALIGSSGLLEIAVRNGSAQKTLRLHVGDAVDLHD